MTNEYKEIEVIVSLGGFEMTSWIDVPTDCTKMELFQYILHQIELDYDDEWALGVSE